MSEEISEILLQEALTLVATLEHGSVLIDPISFLQRNLRIGYRCALSLAEALESKGIWSSFDQGEKRIELGISEPLNLHIGGRSLKGDI